MKEETRYESIVSDIKHYAFKAVCPIYLWSIGKKSMDDYSGDMILHELVYSDGSFAADVIKEFVSENKDMKFDGSESYFKRLTEIENLLRSN